jgi:hypothetical protein
MSEHNVAVARERCEAFVRNHLAVSPPELDPDTESDETNLSDRGGARDQPTCAKDQQQKRRLSVLLLDEPGCGGAPLRFLRAAPRENGSRTHQTPTVCPSRQYDCAGAITEPA